MADKLQSGIKAGSTSVSLPAFLRLTSTQLGATGKVAADLTLSYWRQGGSVTTVSDSDLAAINSAYSSGGVKEASAANQPGEYRVDWPDAAFAASADWVVLSVVCSGTYNWTGRFALTTHVVQSGDSYAVVNNGAFGLNAIMGIITTGVNVATLSSTAIQSIWDALTSSLTTVGSIGKMLVDRINDTITSRHASGAAVASVTGNVGGNVQGNVVGSVGSLATTAQTNVRTQVDAGIAAVGLTTTITGRIDVATSTRLATAGYTAPSNSDIAAIKVVTDKLGTAVELDGSVYRFTLNALELAPSAEGGLTASVIADAVWDEVLSGHSGAGSAGLALSSVGDPWSVSLPGSYGSGTAGNIVGNRLDVAVGTRFAASTWTADYVAPDNSGIVVASSQASASATSAAEAVTLATAVKVKTDQFVFTGGRVNAVLEASAWTAAADALINRNIEGGSNTGRTVGQVFAFQRNKWEIDANTNTLIVYRVDDVTESWRAPLTLVGGLITRLDPP
jgi:hypothetical protein